MGCSVVIPFQMMEAPIAEIEKRVMDSAKDVAESSTCFLRINRLHSGEGVQFNNDVGDVHLMSKNDAIFQGNRFNCIRRVMGWQGFAQSRSDMST